MKPYAKPRVRLTAKIYGPMGGEQLRLPLDVTIHAWIYKNHRIEVRHATLGRVR